MIRYNYNSITTNSYRSIKCKDGETASLMCKRTHMQQRQHNQIRDCFLAQSTDRIVIESTEITIVSWENNQNELRLSLIIETNCDPGYSHFRSSNQI